MDAIERWIAGHDGNLPKQKSEDVHERSLANFYKDLTSRQAGPIRGGKWPTDQKLTFEESQCFAKIGAALERGANQNAVDVPGSSGDDLQENSVPIWKEIVQFQTKNDGRLPRRSRKNPYENNLCKCLARSLLLSLIHI